MLVPVLGFRLRANSTQFASSEKLAAAIALPGH